jgi:hypothetical protein
MTKTALGLELSVEEQDDLFNTLARKPRPSVVEVLAMERLNTLLLNRERVAEWELKNGVAKAVIVSRYEAKRKLQISGKTHYLFDKYQGLCGIWRPEYYTDQISETNCHTCRRRYNNGTVPR